MDIVKQTLKAVDKIFKPQKSLQFDIVKNKPSIFDCKLGGVPYFPKNMKYPVGKDSTKDPLGLLIQINFSQIDHLQNYPKTGILQIFIDRFDCYGMDFDNLTSQKLFRIIYHKDIITDESQLIDTLPYEIDKSEEMPFTGEYKLVQSNTTTMYAEPSIEGFEDIFVEEYNKIADTKIDSIFDLEDSIVDSIFHRNESKPIYLGGYPIFTQNDPRYQKKYQKYDTTLLTIDSYYKKSLGIDLMWGDSGACTFLMTKDDLKALNFTKVLYNWDCY